ncbi:hypothetical protein AB0467_08195 [Streptomyces sp. NPDC052095]|uniref:hypothetical protein n=1 Tax=Streptomyces sp. NPDC052095 TaxID=3155678 RepID=UPI00345074BA
MAAWLLGTTHTRWPAFAAGCGVLTGVALAPRPPPTATRLGILAVSCTGAPTLMGTTLA